MLRGTILLTIALFCAISVSSERPPSITPLASRPAVFLVENLLEKSECDELIKFATPNLIPSGTKGGQSDQKERKSSSYFVPRENSSHPIVNKLVRRMQESMKELTSVAEGRVFPVNEKFAEVFQVTRYDEGDYYKGHNDFVEDSPHYDRVATYLVYLDDTESGGETVFPYLSPSPRGDGSFEWNRNTDFRSIRCKEYDPACKKSTFPFQLETLEYCCCKELLRVKPKAGTAVIFFPALPNGRKDAMSAHAACPVLKGKKHVVQQWFHGSPLPIEHALFADNAVESEEKKNKKKKAKKGKKKNSGKEL